MMHLKNNNIKTKIYYKYVNLPFIKFSCVISKYKENFVPQLRYALDFSYLGALYLFV